MAPIEEVSKQLSDPKNILSKIGPVLQKNGITIIIVVILVGFLFSCLPLPNMFGNTESDRTIPKNVFERFDDGNSGRAGDIDITLFYVNWCGYCKEAKPHFQEFMNMNNNSVVNNKNIKIKMIDCESSKENQQIAKNVGVDGYPTITAQFGDRLEKYEGPRTLDAFNNWLSKM